MDTIKTPILLIGFNRPDDFQQSFNAIKKVKPQKLYVAIDGPRPNKLGEIDKVKKVRAILDQIDWECKLYRRFSDKNLGCKGNITSALSWVFEYEDRVIVVEDDIVAPPSFFIFEEEMLEKYKDDERIAMVTGNNYTPINTDADYLFSLYAGHIWGWGTWKRLWNKFDVNVHSLEDEFYLGLPKVRSHTKSIKEYFFYYDYFRNLRMAQIKGKDNYWGPQFSYFRLENGLLNIVPKHNLASNIGCASSRDSNNDSEDGTFYFESDKEFVVKHYPSVIERDVKYDRYHFQHHIFNKHSPKMLVWYLYNIFRHLLLLIKRIL